MFLSFRSHGAEWWGYSFSETEVQEAEQVREERFGFSLFFFDKCLGCLRDTSVELCGKQLHGHIWSQVIWKVLTC